ncbi:MULTISPECIES: hypothetical protein [Halomonadaceae]|uniref:hypothetical protein n=1 Tax=Halomonadaceae TaxID=28256 RepID=UPI001597E877|nr:MULTISPECIES: hypothetical protein [Halomonas]QJQ93902.1 hypothetical protein HIO72_00400 [Halomonas sp. PA5]
MAASRVALLIGGGALFIGYLTISQPDKLVVDAYGQIEGVLNQARATLQQERFWKGQLDKARYRIQYLEDSMERHEAPQARLQKKIDESRKTADEYFDEYPDISGQYAYMASAELRDLADAITDLQWEVEFDEWDRKALSDTRSARAFIEARLQ